ncbi:cytochrome c oxidase subunit II [Bremerella sp. T1]|uniref:cytochrome c oxidase subunit II n=1 Tax=Bremerella sp. TYQ1 TaxID=3119568 RepID=UPI001CC9ADCB|nr:cytochrome c oxidase subunit II [Bremerella volcania]UBM37348.1 cytochrome c oxidase subunit II [Bremerella volcania]
MESTFPVFDPASPQAESIRDLFVQVLIISAGIFAIVAGLICLALYRFRVTEKVPVQDFGSHRREIFWMVGPVIIVVWIAVISIKLILTLNALPTQYVRGAENGNDGVDIVVTGHQWWWEIEYADSGIVSANEIHIPTGKKLRVALRSEDVIHCFWVAQLTRKMDAIPGHENFVWLEANTPGTYQGRCAEYCGTQHAWMNFLVIAHEPDDFEAWKQRELKSSEAPDSELASQGSDLFMKLTCSQCHAISGTDAKQDFAPDLTHVASRKQIGAGVIENSPENLRTWLANPQALKPGCKMPNFKLNDEQLDQLVAYLETLR